MVLRSCTIHPRASALCLTFVIACGGPRPAEAPGPVRRAPPTAEERARFDDADARCQAEDDCEDLSRYWDDGMGTEVDHERARAYALKACLGGFSFVCSKAVFMRGGVAAPGTHLMTDARCKGEDPDTFVCSELDTLRRDEDAASPAVKAACAALVAAGDAESPRVLGPLVDRCPGLASTRQRERARLLRSEEAIARAVERASTASPRQLRRTYERIAPLGDPRADEVLAIGLRRFATPPTESFAKKRDDIRRLPAVRPQLDLCAIDGDLAFLAPVANRAGDAAEILLRFVAPIVFPPAWPFLFPDAPKSQEERKVEDEAARQRAAEVERQLKEATGATTMVMITTCDDVRWFVEQSVKSRASARGD